MWCKFGHEVLDVRGNESLELHRVVNRSNHFFMRACTHCLMCATFARIKLSRENAGRGGLAGHLAFQSVSTCACIECLAIASLDTRCMRTRKLIETHRASLGWACSALFNSSLYSNSVTIIHMSKWAYYPNRFFYSMIEITAGPPEAPAPAHWT